MSFYMMYPDQRLLRRVCDCFRLRNSDQKSAHKPRTICNADRMDLFQCNFRFRQCSLYYLIDLLNMFPGSDLRNDPAVQGVQRYL